MLLKLLRQIEKEFSSQPYLSTLYKALFSTAYFGMFRVGELTKGTHPVLANDVKIGSNKNKIKFILYHSKMHGRNNKPHEIIISSQKLNGNIKDDDEYCPFKLLNDYMRVRGPIRKGSAEQFFVFSDKSPVLASHMSKALKLLLKKANYNDSEFGTHSFRIGRSHDLLKLGLSIETIKCLGRWKSNAVFRYLK